MRTWTDFQRAEHRWKARRAYARSKGVSFDDPKPKREDYEEVRETEPVSALDSARPPTLVDPPPPPDPGRGSGKRRFPTNGSSDPRELLAAALERAKEAGTFGLGEDGEALSFWDALVKQYETHPNVATSILGRLVPQQTQDVISRGELQAILRVLVEAVTRFVDDQEVLDKIIGHLREGLQGPLLGDFVRAETGT